MCNVPVLVSYDSSGIRYQVTINDVTTLRNLTDLGATYMDYDPLSRRLFFYVSENLYSIKQDGTDLIRITQIDQFENFIVDGSNNIIYYIHESTDNIYMLNMTNLESGEVLDLAGVSSPKDIDIDHTNK